MFTSSRDMKDPSKALASTSSGKFDSDLKGNTPIIPPPLPESTHYEAGYFFETHCSDIVSNDPRLNSDGEALCRFLLSQAASYPTLRITCRGTHTKDIEYYNTDIKMNSTRTVTITDFDFCIDIVPDCPVVQWSVADDEPAYRGCMERESEASMGSRASQDGHLLFSRSSKTLRQWADEYCASPKKMKEFAYKKVVCGWNMQQLVDAIRTTIMLSAPYTGKVDVSYKTSGSNIYIRSKEFSMKRKSLFCLYKYFRSKDGGRWEVCGGAYPLKQWVPATSQIAKGSTGYMQSPTGPMELLGVQEGEWLRTWEAVIMRAVRSDYQCSISINNGFAGAAVRAYDLDGYN